MPTIAAIILTYNEEIHIARCIRSLQGVVDQIYVVDSFSTDKTTDIAENLGAKVLQHTFVNQAVQFNWALDTLKIDTDWIFRIDADEYIDNKNRLDLKQHLSTLPNDVNGLLIKRKIVFLGKALTHGGWYPKWNLRLFRTGFGKCETRLVDEHIVLTAGNVAKLDLDVVDENLNDLSWWTAKHNNYANREAFEYFLHKQRLDAEVSVNAKFWGTDAERKRWLKMKYLQFPLFVRPLLNFLYRYLFLFGFLDGVEGLIWHFLQGLWYRFLVDAKIFELKRKFKNDICAICDFIKNNSSI